MMHLIKYEWKKTLFLKLFLLAVVLIGEAIFLYCAFTRDFDSLAMNVSILILSLGLMLSPIISILQNLSLLHRELNCKEAYMLYLTPHNSFTILGAKWILSLMETVIWTALAVAFATIDTLLLIHLTFGFTPDVMARLNELVQVALTPKTLQIVLQICFLFFAGLLQFESIAVIAIVLQATFLHWKRGSGFVILVLYLLLMYLSTTILMHLPFSSYMLFPFAGSYLSMRALGQVLVSLLLSAAYFVISALLLEKKRNI